MTDGATEKQVEQAAEYMKEMALMEIAFTGKRRREILSILGYYREGDSEYRVDEELR